MFSPIGVHRIPRRHHTGPTRAGRRARRCPNSRSSITQRRFLHMRRGHQRHQNRSRTGSRTRSTNPRRVSIQRGRHRQHGTRGQGPSRHFAPSLITGQPTRRHSHHRHTWGRGRIRLQANRQRIRFFSRMGNRVANRAHRMRVLKRRRRARRCRHTSRPVFQRAIHYDLTLFRLRRIRIVNMPTTSTVRRG